MERRFNLTSWLVGVAAMLCWSVSASAQPSTQDIAATMAGYSLALGVRCDYCHEASWNSDTKASFVIARSMAAMVTALNGSLLKGTPGITCWTCHAGQRQPSRLPPQALAEGEAQWPGELEPNHPRKLTMTVYDVTLGVSCEYCHVISQWRAAGKAPYQMVATMVAMFDEFPKYMPPTARTQCWMCHKGLRVPRRQPDRPRP